MASGKRNTADFYTLMAHKNGYPARSVYKLEEIQKQNNIVKNNSIVLDVGASPGSWTLFVYRELLKTGGKIVSVDLNPLAVNIPSDRVFFYQGDAFSDQIKDKLKEHSPYDAIISDVAPMTTGNRTVDTSKSEYLAEQVLLLAEQQLKTHGNLVIKIFQGGGQIQLLNQMKKEFVKAKTFKPKACRSDSFETYLIGLDFREKCELC